MLDLYLALKPTAGDESFARKLLGLIRGVRVGVLCCNAARRLQKSIEWLEGWQLRAPLAQSLNDFFGRDISNQSVLSERAAAKATDGGVESAAAGIIRSLNLLDSLVGTAVQMHSNLKIVILVQHTADQLFDLFRSSNTDCVGERD